MKLLKIVDGTMKTLDSALTIVEDDYNVEHVLGQMEDIPNPKIETEVVLGQFVTGAPEDLWDMHQWLG